MACWMTAWPILCSARLAIAIESVFVTLSVSSVDDMRFRVKGNKKQRCLRDDRTLGGDVPCHAEFFTSRTPGQEDKQKTREGRSREIIALASQSQLSRSLAMEIGRLASGKELRQCRLGYHCEHFNSPLGDNLQTVHAKNAPASEG